MVLFRGLGRSYLCYPARHGKRPVIPTATPSVTCLMKLFRLLTTILLVLPSLWVIWLNPGDCFLAAEKRAPPETPAVGSPAQTLQPIPQPSLGAVQGSVREQIEAAWAELQAASQQAGGNQAQLADAYGQMGRVYHAYDFSDAAAACYRNAMNLAARDFSWPYCLGRLYQEKGEVKKSIEHLRLAHRLRPDEIPVLVRLAEAYLADGQSEAARELFERSLKLDGSLAASMAGLGKIAISERSFTKAIELLKAALQLQPEASSLHYPLAMAYRGLGDRQRAQAHLVQQGPGKPLCPDPLIDDLERLKKGEMILWRRGNQAMHEGRYADAVKLYSEMVDFSKVDPLPRIYLGNALAASNKLEDAIDQYQQVLRLMPHNATAHYNLGVIFLQTNSEPRAIEHFRTAITSDPGLKVAHFQLANLSVKNRHYEDAVRHYSQVIELSPENEFARLMKALSLVRLAKYRDARRDLEDGVASLPDSSDLTLALARLLAACPDKTIRNGSRALQLVENLLKSHPSPDFELVETYAMAMASSGRLPEAADLQRRMIETVQSAGRHDLATVLQRNLKLYEQGQACSTPWRDDDPIFSPKPGKMALIAPRDTLGMTKRDLGSP
jgi:tetratricopeptide (TPR) repeat protein